jgi:hypothetical protein
MFPRLLALTVVVLAVAARADSGFLYTAGGTLWRVDEQGMTQLLDCRRGAQLVGRVETIEPCRLNSLTVHPASGRYALTVDAPVSRRERRDGSAEAFAITTFLELAGRRHVPPRTKAGEPLDGAYLVIGHPRASSQPQVLEGLRDTWRFDGRFYPQSPLVFAADGEGLLVTEYVGSERMRLWTVDLRGAPRWRLELGGQIYNRITLAPGAKAIELHTVPGLVAFLDIPLSVAKPLTRPVPRRLPGAIAVAKVGDTVISFRGGDPDASDSDPAWFGSFLRTSANGQSREWRRSGGPGVRDTVLAVSEPRRSVLVEDHTQSGGRTVVEYFVEEDRAVEHALWPENLLALTPDGRGAALLANGGLEIHGLVDGQVWWRAELPEKLPRRGVQVAFAEFAP